MSEELRKALESAADKGEQEDGDESSKENKTESGNADGDDGESDEDDKTSKSDKSGSPDDDDEEDNDDEKDEEENLKAKALDVYRKLTNPETAVTLLQQIAKNAGYKFEELDAKDRKVMREEIEDIFKEELGEDYSLLAPNFSKALRRVIDSEISKATAPFKDIQDRVARQEQTAHQREVDDTLKWAGEHYVDFEDAKVQKKILREMKEMPPAPGVNYKNYLVKICKLVGVATKEDGNNNRNSRNKTNKDGREPSDGVRSERSTKVPMTLRQSIESAFEEQQK